MGRKAQGEYANCEFVFLCQRILLCKRPKFWIAGFCEWGLLTGENLTCKLQRAVVVCRPFPSTC